MNKAVFRQLHLMVRDAHMMNDYSIERIYSDKRANGAYRIKYIGGPDGSANGHRKSQVIIETIVRGFIRVACRRDELFNDIFIGYTIEWVPGWNGGMTIKLN